MLIIVLAGKPTLRTLKGECALEEGDVVACPAGRQGAHRLDACRRKLRWGIVILERRWRSSRSSSEAR
jgi:uncharacterized cupin superfamily protein